MADRVSGVQSLRRGLGALEVAIDRDVRPSELAEILQVGRTTALRLLQTLVDEGYVKQSPTTKAFRANPAKIFLLASKLGSSLGWLGMAERFLTELAQATGETANLAVLEGAEAVYVAVAPSANALSVRPLIGTRRPIHSSAIGKAMIAFLDEAERARLLERAGLPQLTWRTITSLEVLEDQLREVRATGYAVDDQESINGVRCLAAPVLDRSLRPFAAIGISAPWVRMTGRSDARTLRRDEEYRRPALRVVVACRFEYGLGPGRRQGQGSSRIAPRLTGRVDKNIPAILFFSVGVPRRMRAGPRRLAEADRSHSKARVGSGFRRVKGGDALTETLS